MKRGIWFAGEVPAQRMVELAQKAEAAGKKHAKGEDPALRKH